MKNQEIKLFDLKNEYNLNISEVMYNYATKLLDQVADEDILDLYANNNCFATISTMNKEEILENQYLLADAISALEKHIESKEYENEIDEVIEQIRSLDITEIKKLLELLK